MLTSRDALVGLRKGKVMVTTNGVFDILHAGHVEYLQRAKALGDILVVALNSDSSARSLQKGPGRPINSLSDRAAVIAALRCVDAVVSFDEPTPEQILSVLKPDIHVKGGDYIAEDMPETQVVQSNGGKVVILPYLEGRSTTRIIERLADLESGD